MEAQITIETYNIKIGEREIEGAFFHASDKTPPLIIFKSGSGSKGYDDSDFSRMLIDYLVENGISVYRYSDRSGELYNDSTLEDFAHDMCDVINELRERRSEQNKMIGIGGHSMGGMVSLISGAMCDDVDFIVLLATPLDDMVEYGVYQKYNQRFKSQAEWLKSVNMKIWRKYFEWLSGKRSALWIWYLLVVKWLYSLRASRGRGSIQLVKKNYKEWLWFKGNNTRMNRSVYKFNYAKYIPVIESPILAIYSTNDENIRSKVSADSLLKSCKNYDLHCTIHEISDVDHCFRKNGRHEKIGSDVVPHIVKFLEGVVR